MTKMSIGEEWMKFWYPEVCWPDIREFFASLERDGDRLSPGAMQKGDDKIRKAVEVNQRMFAAGR